MTKFITKLTNVLTYDIRLYITFLIALSTHGLNDTIWYFSCGFYALRWVHLRIKSSCSFSPSKQYHKPLVCGFFGWPSHIFHKLVFIGCHRYVPLHWPFVRTCFWQYNRVNTTNIHHCRCLFPLSLLNLMKHVHFSFAY